MEDLYEEMAEQAEDEEILDGMKEKKNRKSFGEIINKKKLSKFELDEAMSEA